MHDKNLLVVGSGDTSQEKIKKWADEIAAKLPTDNKPVVTEVPAPTNANHRRLQIVDKPDRTQTQMSAGQIGVKMTDSDFFPLYVGNHILGGFFVFDLVDDRDPGQARMELRRKQRLPFWPAATLLARASLSRIQGCCSRSCRNSQADQPE